jgi:hypothetical protein
MTSFFLIDLKTFVFSLVGTTFFEKLGKSFQLSMMKVQCRKTNIIKNLARGDWTGRNIKTKCSWPWPSSFFPDFFSLAAHPLQFFFSALPLEIAHVILW